MQHDSVSPQGFFSRIMAAAGIALLNGAISLLSRCNYRRTLERGTLLGSIGFALLWRLRGKMLHNLQLAFGSALPSDAVRAHARAALQNACKNWIELAFAGGPQQAEVLDGITVTGREHLDQALERGRGVIAVSAHLGNYPLLGAKLRREGYPFMMVIRNLPSAAGSAVYAAGREKIHLPAIATEPERAFFKQALQIVRNNGILCLIADENKRRGGVFVDFFGRPAATAPGPAALALRTGAALLPMFIVRHTDNSQEIIIVPALDVRSSGDNSRDTRSLTAAYTAIIEQHIRRDPSQWIWTNWRWRTQPWGKAPEAKIPGTFSFKRLRKALRRRLG